MTNLDNFRSKIPANKFYPPRVESSQCLLRQNLINNVLLKKGRSKQAIVIEAQAGQGKTTLIIQYLERINKDYAWYQIGPEDSDPVLLLKSLIACLNSVFPEFSAPLLEQIIASGEISALDLNRLTNLLLGDLDSFLQDDFYFVFDDIHLLHNAEASRSLLNYLFQTAPPRIHFILASRQPVELTSKHLKYSGQLLRLTNHDLAMSQTEISELYNEILHITASPQIIQKIHQVTEGWTMGIILAGHDLEKRQEYSSRKSHVHDLAVHQGEMLSYFREEIFLQLPEKLRQPFLLLSFLDEIPVDLARRITGLGDIGQLLKEIVGDNLFVRRLDEDSHIFGFHHLFQEFLQERARQELTEDEVNTVLCRAGQFCLEQKKIASALRYFLKAGDLDTMEKILAQNGMDFLAMNQTATLASILQSIPEEHLLAHGWLSLFSGMVILDSRPEKVQPFLERAMALFSEQNEGIGELLAISHLIHYYNVTSGVSKEGIRYLEKSATLFDQHSESISDYSKILIATNLATGFALFISDFKTSNRFSSLAITLSRQLGAVNFQAAAVVVQGFERMMSSQEKLCLENVEQAQTLIYLPLIGTFNMMALRFLQVNYLIQYGSDSTNYFHQKSTIVDMVGKDIIKHSLPGLYFYLFDMDIALGKGQNDRVLELASLGLATDSGLLSPNIHSSFLEYQSFALALQQKKDKALAAADESLKLRISAGVPYYVAKNKRFIGSVYGLCGNYEQAVHLLTESIQGAKDLPNSNELASGYLYRAYFHLQAGKKKNGLADLRKGLQIMRRHRYVHFLGWTPLMMEPLLVLAIEEKIEADYTRHLAAERLNLVILDNAGIIPLLKIKTLGGLRISIKDEVIIASEELTPAQRELITLLVTSPNLKLSQEKIQVALWPDSPPEKARTKFDTLLSRCRKTLSQATRPHSAKNYLNLQKGILCLENCRIDVIQFITKINKGMQHARHKENWQVSNAFYHASVLWQGDFIPNVTGNEDVRNFRDELLLRFVEMSLKWAEILSQSGRQAEAISVISKPLQYDSTNDLLVRSLYHLHGHSPVAQAQQVLKDYEQALRDAEYSPEEIEELSADIASPSIN